MKVIAAVFVLKLTMGLGFAESIGVYFGTGPNESDGIYYSILDAKSGKLGPASLVADIRAPEFLAMNDRKTHLYAVVKTNESFVAAFSIKSDGGLDLLNTVSADAGRGTHIAVHPSGRFLLTAHYSSASVTLLPIEEDGRLGERQQLIRHTGGSGVNPGRQKNAHPHWVGFSPDGDFAFVADLGKDQIVVYEVSEDRTSISHHGEIDALPGSGPRHMRFSVDGQYIYLLNELPQSVTTFEYNAESGLAKRKTTTKALSENVMANETFNSGSEIVVHPSGRFVYSGNRGNDSVTVYKVDQQTGSLSAIDVEAIRGSWPRNINLDPSGRWLLAAGAHSNTVSAFTVDPDAGTLSFTRGNIINVPNPICILFRE